MESSYEKSFEKDLENYELNEKLEKARNVVLGFTASTSVTGAIPIPFADAPLLITQQVAMMVAINSVFKMEVDKNTLKALAAGAIGVGGVTVAGKTIASNLIKLIPGPGSIVGGAVSAGTAGVLTLALGNAYIEVCRAVQNGTLRVEDLGGKKGMLMLKDSFKAELKKNKKK